MSSAASGGTSGGASGVSTGASAGSRRNASTTRSSNCVPQLGTADRLDALADRGMFRNAYRNFGDHEALVGNMTVSSGGVAGVRWWQLSHVTSGTPTFEASVRLRDRVAEIRSENSRTGEFPVWVRVPKADPEDFGRYEAEGLDQVLIWSDQVWPSEGDLEMKRAALAAAAAMLGVEPGGSDAV